MGMLAGKTALVTGAGRGIGRGIAPAPARARARVAVNGVGASLEGEGSEPGPADQVVLDERPAGEWKDLGAGRRVWRSPWEEP